MSQAKIIILGAELSDLGAARSLADSHEAVTVIEAQDGIV